MLRYRCHFEWCHRAKLAALNYCRPFDAVYIPAVLSTHIIILQIPDPRPDIVNKAAQKHKQQRLVMMIQHIGMSHCFAVDQQLANWGRVAKGVPR